MRVECPSKLQRCQAKAMRKLRVRAANEIEAPSMAQGRVSRWSLRTGASSSAFGIAWRIWMIGKQPS
eukprot:10420145-Prorocentrum_lima.AAC.1